MEPRWGQGGRQVEALIPSADFGRKRNNDREAKWGAKVEKIKKIGKF